MTDPAQPTPEQMERADTIANDTCRNWGITHRGQEFSMANQAALAAILQADQQQAELRQMIVQLGANAAQAAKEYVADKAELLAHTEAIAGALEQANDAIKEMFRYYDGGETRGSYDGKPERNQLRKAGYACPGPLTAYREYQKGRSDGK